MCVLTNADQSDIDGDFTNLLCQLGDTFLGTVNEVGSTQILDLVDKTLTVSN